MNTIDKAPTRYEQAEDLMPEWAIKRASGFMEVGAQLATKDGRVIGNAYVSALDHVPGLGNVATVITDMGNSARLNESELQGLFFDPIWVMDVQERKGRADWRESTTDMLAALIVAREFISTDRNAFADAAMPPEGTAMEAYDAAELADYDAALLQIDAAIKKAGAA
jgi:hypothetical protein